MIEIRTEDGDCFPCRTLKTAVNRMFDLKQKDQRKGLWLVTRWLVDTKATKAYSAKHPTKRLAAAVYVRAPNGGAL